MKTLIAIAIIILALNLIALTTLIIFSNWITATICLAIVIVGIPYLLIKQIGKP